MVQKSKFTEGDAISGGVWTAKLFERIRYFGKNNDIEQMTMMLPFGLLRQSKPKNYELIEKAKRTQEGMQTLAKTMRTRRLGMFYAEEDMEIKPWKPEQTVMQSTTDFESYMPTKFVLKHDPTKKRVMYLEQDLLAHPIANLTIDGRTGFSYLLKKDRNVIVRKFLVVVKEEVFLQLVLEFIDECNRILYLYCDTN